MAVGLAQKSVKPKLSKSCDMRLHWLQDRVAQRQFVVRHIPGAINVADFFTKPLPVHRLSEVGGSLLRYGMLG